MDSEMTWFQLDYFADYHTVKIEVYDLNQLAMIFHGAMIKMARYISAIRTRLRDSHMNQEVTGTESDVRVPIMQRIIDNPFILLFIGVVFPAVFYIIWGIMELVSIPIAP